MSDILNRPFSLSADQQASHIDSLCAKILIPVKIH